MGSPQLVHPPAARDLSSVSDCRTLVQAFYERARQDALLAPVFASRIADADWPAHLERMAGFWATILFGLPLFHGNPVESHRHLPITHDHFERWLTLWLATIDDLFAGAVANEAKLRARRMARVLGERIGGA